jgi:hypothetical protein
MTDYYRLHVLLRPDNPQDALVIEALERLGGRGKSKWVRRVLYEAVTGPARSEILAEVQAVKLAVERLERNGLTVQAEPDQEQEKEPDQAAENLDGMLDRLADW